MSVLSKLPMEAIVKDAWREGQSVDLTGIGYGRVHWGNFKDINNHPSPYYQFLSGLVRLIGAR